MFDFQRIEQLDRRSDGVLRDLDQHVYRTFEACIAIGSDSTDKRLGAKQGPFRRPIFSEPTTDRAVVDSEVVRDFIRGRV